jgi:ubiquinone/menaquinone biosynthesis C-methylase UbiE
MVSLLFHELPIPIAKKVCAEVFRALRPGGVFTVIDFPGERGSTVYSMFFAAMDAADNVEPYIPEFRRSNTEDLMEEAGFVLRDFDPKKIFQKGRIGVKPS